MANTRASSYDQLGLRFLSLPRELRDIIYAYVVIQDASIELTNGNIEAPLDHPIISAEWLEALYTHSTCSVSFSDFRLLRDSRIKPNLWGTHAWYKRFIRHLVVSASEVVLYQSDLEELEHECTFAKPEVRQEWDELLELPYLESLTINLQKWGSMGFVWANFSPILYRLRERLPRLRITFSVSFDAILENKWNFDLYLDDPRQDRTAHALAMEEDPYLPMGFVEMSELIELPTDEDRLYVKEHLPEVRDVGSVDIVRGLLDETPASRRILAQHYIVKEPALLRLMMAAHYEVYKQTRDRGGEGSSTSG